MLNHLKNEFNKTQTANGAFAYASTKSDVLDLFALGGAYRNRKDEEVVQLFSKAFAENTLLALKTLFYLRDVTQGQGERRFFRLALNHLALHNKEALSKNLHLIPSFGRWDDLWVLLETSLKNEVVELVRQQLLLDRVSDSPSLLGKWMPSENASSLQTKKYARILIQAFNTEPKKYRKLLSKLRKKINIVETKLTRKNYKSIQYDKLPSKAGMIYRGAFFRNDEVRYKEFLDSLSKGEKTVNAGTLYPYEIVSKALGMRYGQNREEVQLLDGMWNNLPNFIGDRKENSIAVVDVSGSMYGTPMEVAISLGIYLAERNEGHFHNHFFTFSERPSLQQIKGTNIVEKVSNMSRADWGMSTNIESVFKKILLTAVNNNVPADEMIDRLYIISDMQFNQCVSGAKTHIFKNLAEQFELNGYKLPKLVFWNVNAFMSNVPFTMDENGVQLVSGFSPSIFQNLLGNEEVNPYELMLEVVNSERYKEITV
ncbi:DUF2828 family protein [Halobacillus rhizosphaerae]|uniref:DUF2828 family protein n=1 Tax=Halobacillus rhizosphaerae TaxID=3064889 RepID=UPI00398B783B